MALAAEAEPLLRHRPPRESILDLPGRSCWGLDSYHSEAPLRLCLGLGSALLDEFGHEPDPTSGVFEDAEHLLVTPEEAVRRRRLQHLERDLADGMEDHSRWLSFFQATAHSIGLCVIVVLTNSYGRVEQFWEEDWAREDLEACEYLSSWGLYPADQALAAELEFGEASGPDGPEGLYSRLLAVRRRLHDSARAELIAWAIGHSDPILERVSKRLEGSTNYEPR